VRRCTRQTALRRTRQEPARRSIDPPLEAQPRHVERGPQAILVEKCRDELLDPAAASRLVGDAADKLVAGPVGPQERDRDGSGDRASAGRCRPVSVRAVRLDEHGAAGGDVAPAGGQECRPQACPGVHQVTSEHDSRHAAIEVKRFDVAEHERRVGNAPADFGKHCLRLIQGDDVVAERREWRGDTTGPASKLQDLAVGREAHVEECSVDQRRVLVAGQLQVDGHRAAIPGHRAPVAG
jgi:hypothetical protein